MIVTNDIAAVLGSLPKGASRLQIELIEQPKALPVETVNWVITDGVVGMMLSKVYLAGAMMPASILGKVNLAAPGDRCYWVRRAGPVNFEWREVTVVKP